MLTKYINYKELTKDINIKKDIKYINRIPKIVHRTLLFDPHIPLDCIQYFIQFDHFSQDYLKILWREQDVLEIMSNAEKHIYKLYTHKIQKADYARYIILFRFGGIYADFDIVLQSDLNNLMQQSRRDFICLEETTLSEQQIIQTAKYPIRQILSPDERAEPPLRIANYFIASSKGCYIWYAILQLCKLRSKLSIRYPYDIIFTTGPDVISTVVNKLVDQRSFIDILYLYHTRPILRHLQDKDYHKNSQHWRQNI